MTAQSLALVHSSWSDNPLQSKAGLDLGDRGKGKVGGGASPEAGPELQQQGVGFHDRPNAGRAALSATTPDLPGAYRPNTLGCMYSVPPVLSVVDTVDTPARSGRVRYIRE